MNFTDSAIQVKGD